MTTSAAGATPATALDPRYSEPEATAMAWDAACVRWQQAELYWLSTVRPDGRPHVTPLIAVWHDGATYFCTGPQERKAKNLRLNPNVVLTTGSNALDLGLDLVVEGEAVRETDTATLHRVADAYLRKYGPGWHFQVRDGAFAGEGGTALVFRVAPRTAFGFAKGAYSQTRWRFED